jgi:aminomethyltransferase
VVNAGTCDKDLAWMNIQASKFAVTLKPRRDLAMIAVQGPQARALFWQTFPATRTASEALIAFQAAECVSSQGEWLIARTGYTGEDGFEVSLPAAHAPDIWTKLREVGVIPCGLGARDTLRLEAGMNLYGQDMDESVSPLEAGLTWTLAMQDSRDFIGKAALLVARPTKHFLGLVLQERGVPRSHQRVVTAHGDGEITSGSFSPTLQLGIALARLPLGVLPGDIVDIEIRDKLLKAKVVKPPFVRNGKPLI